MRIVGESLPIDCQQVFSQIRVSEELDVEFAEQAIQFGWRKVFRVSRAEHIG